MYNMYMYFNPIHFAGQKYYWFNTDKPHDNEISLKVQNMYHN